MEEIYVEWSGGYLNRDTVVVTLGGETEDGQEWFRHYPVDARTGRVGAAFDTQGENAYDIQPLGDGSWLTNGPDGHPIRWSSS